jgi:hypothetical protein
MGGLVSTTNRLGQVPTGSVQESGQIAFIGRSDFFLLINGDFDAKEV